MPWSIHSSFFLGDEWLVMIINPPTFCYGFLYPSFGHRLFLNQILDHQHLFFLDNTGKVGTENGISFRRGYRVLIFGHVFSWVIKSCSVFKVEGDKVFWREQASPVPLLSLLWNFTHPFRRRKNQLLGARHDETAVCVAVNQVLHYIWSIYYLIGETVFLFFFWWCQFLWVTHRLTVFKPENTSPSSRGPEISIPVSSILVLRRCLHPFKWYSKFSLD